MRQYHHLLETILADGVVQQNRTGINTIAAFGHQSRYDLSQGFPLLTSRRIPFKAIVHELIWFISGGTNVRYLQSNGVTIWDKWADANGNLGPVYGAQWRSWKCPDGRVIDQLRDVVDLIQRDTGSRRMVVSAWNPADIGKMALPPCHTLFQFHVSRNRLSCQMYQRSADAFIGVPFNIASYSLLTMIVAKACGLEPGHFIHTIGDAHIYVNHLEQVDMLLKRQLKPMPKVEIPALSGGGFDAILGLRAGDFELSGYDPHPAIQAEVAV